MAQADWTVADDSLGSGSVRRGVSAGFTPPSGGGSFVYGFSSADTNAGAVGLFYTADDFTPMAKGGNILGCMKRGISGGLTGFSPFFFFSLQGPSVTDTAYMLGLSDADPARIVLRKALLTQGLGDVAPDPGNNGVLRRSSTTVARDTWVHLKLDVIYNTNGDVRLQVKQNDLTLHPLGTAPTWTAIAGMDEFVDDALGVNSGSLPLVGGRAGFAIQTADVSRRAYFDAIQVQRQL